MDDHISPTHTTAKQRLGRKRQCLEGPTPQDKSAFWNAVENDDAESVFEFLTKNADLGDVWRRNEVALMPLLESRTASGNAQHQASLSLAVFYRCGFALPDVAWYFALNSWLGSLQSDPRFRVHFPPIMERLEKDVKHKPWLLEVLLVAAATQQNSAVFQVFFPRGAKRCVFDVQPGRLMNMPSLLQAVVNWQDAKLRRDYVTDVLARCSAAYVLLNTYTAVEDDASNALESAVVVADPDIVRLLVQRIKTDNTASVCGDAAARALRLSLSRLAKGASILNPQLAEVHAMLMECMDERCLGGFHEHFAQLRHSLLYLRSSGRPPFANHYPGVVDMLSKCEALFRVVTESAMQKQAALTGSAVLRYEVEQSAFQDRLESYVTVAKQTQILAEENEVLKARMHTMQSVLQKQAHLLHAVTRQAKQIEALKDAQQPEFQKLLDSPFIQEMETRLLKLQLPQVPVSPPASLSAEDDFFGYIAELDALAVCIPSTSPKMLSPGTSSSNKSSHRLAFPLTTDGKN